LLHAGHGEKKRERRGGGKETVTKEKGIKGEKGEGGR
jgi:hypothetical protein